MTCTWLGVNGPGAGCLLVNVCLRSVPRPSSVCRLSYFECVYVTYVNLDGWAIAQCRTLWMCICLAINVQRLGRRG